MAKIIALPGTTNSCVAVMERRPDQGHRNREGAAPRVVSSRTRRTARSSSAHRRSGRGDDPRNTLTPVKRLIGRRFEEKKCRRDINLMRTGLSKAPNVGRLGRGPRQAIRASAGQRGSLRKMKKTRGYLARRHRAE